MFLLQKFWKTMCAFYFYLKENQNAFSYFFTTAGHDDWWVLGLYKNTYETYKINWM